MNCELKSTIEKIKNVIIFEDSVSHLKCVDLSVRKLIPGDELVHLGLLTLHGLALGLQGRGLADEVSVKMIVHHVK